MPAELDAEHPTSAAVNSVMSNRIRKEPFQESEPKGHDSLPKSGSLLRKMYFSVCYVTIPEPIGKTGKVVLKLTKQFKTSGIEFNNLLAGASTSLEKTFSFALFFSLLFVVDNEPSFCIFLLSKNCCLIASLNGLIQIFARYDQIFRIGTFRLKTPIGHSES
uniref:Uncharacterized protein n=1 Tax=Romanomermis culicivorax TaxID=13658 RepID=A0A915L466_ROMCU